MNKKTDKANAVVARGRKNPLRSSGGSKSEHWNNTLVEQAGRAVWLANSDTAERNQRLSAMIAGLVGIAPKDELEGMMAAQLIAAHNASMECYRRAMIDNQTFEGRRENLNQANKLSRTWATLLEALNRHRGKGQQKVTVEHVNAHSGGQAVVGIVGGGTGERRNNPEQGKLAMHLSPRCGAQTRSNKTCRSPAMTNGRCRMHGGKSPGAPAGNNNARKHGRYTAEAIAERRELAELIRSMQALLKELD